MKSFDTMAVGRTRWMRHSRKPSAPMMRRIKPRSWPPENRRSPAKRLSSLMKTKLAIGIRKNPREMIVRRRKSRVEDVRERSVGRSRYLSEGALARARPGQPGRHKGLGAQI